MSNKLQNFLHCGLYVSEAVCLVELGLGTSASQILFTLVSENGPIRLATSLVEHITSYVGEHFC
jgi:hypothetical protein